MSRSQEEERKGKAFSNEDRNGEGQEKLTHLTRQSISRSKL